MKINGLHGFNLILTAESGELVTVDCLTGELIEGPASLALEAKRAVEKYKDQMKRNTTLFQQEGQRGFRVDIYG